MMQILLQQKLFLLTDYKKGLKRLAYIKIAHI